eukprot:CAMPEP_0182453624 /NCGR_PEP_ID=MMETSP1319-20130603/611_1 /TAXON_ID=172717 /ORGANISM="Bolidomonas pacifica, Strain RCC208" /LENGTH=152 /DNA_ID=CAMNT_0024651571 /DNA_START=206 /DNA_END=661 /DNA_ORIENTATION=-
MASCMLQRTFRRLPTPLHRLLPSSPFGTTVTKTSTGLVGLPVHPDPVPALKAANLKILEAVAPIPDSAGYKESITGITNFRLRVIEESEGDIDYIESEIDCGQIEELIVQAEDELDVVDMFLETRLWEHVNRPSKEFVETPAVEEGEEGGDK